MIPYGPERDGGACCRRTSTQIDNSLFIQKLF